MKYIGTAIASLILPCLVVLFAVIAAGDMQAVGGKSGWKAVVAGLGVLLELGFALALLAFHLCIYHYGLERMEEK